MQHAMMLVYIECMRIKLSEYQLKPIIERGTHQEGEYWYWRYDRLS